MKSACSWVVVIGCLAILAACKSGDTSTNPTTNTTVTTSIAGTVSDEAGAAIGGATVLIGGQSTQTDSHGAFAIQNVAVPSARCVLIAKKSGYYNAAVANTPVSNGMTRFAVRMMALGTVSSITASSGGTVIASNASVQFPAGGFTLNGSAYNGTAHVSARYLDPTQSSFGLYFSGDLAATTVSGSATNLLSYGVLRVDLRDDAGNALQPAPGKPAQLTYPIPSSKIASAPATLPLWYFDEQTGVWKEEGFATKQGTNYVGTVTHFTDWNCDDTTGTAEVIGHVTCGTQPIAGVVVRIGQGYAVTDGNGLYKRRVPANQGFTMSIEKVDNGNMYWGSPLGTLVQPLAPGQTDIEDFALFSPCPKKITAKIVDVNGNPTPARVHWEGPDGTGGEETTFDGNLSFMAVGDTSIRIEVTAFGCGGVLTQTVSTKGGTSVDIGTLRPCDGGQSGDMDVTAYGLISLVALNDDASVIALGGYSPVVSVRNRAGTPRCVITIGLGVDTALGVNSIQLSADGSRLLVSPLYALKDTVIVYETATGNAIASFSGIQAPFLTADGQTMVGVNVGTFNDHYIASYSVATGQELHRYAAASPGRSFQLLGLSPDGNTAVYTTDFRSTLVLYDLQHDVVLKTITVPVSSNYPIINLSRDLTHAAIFASDSSSNIGVAMNVYVVNLTTGAVVTSTPFQMSNLSEPGLSPDNASIAFQPNYSITTGDVPAPVIATVSTGAVTTTLSTPAPTIFYGAFHYSSNGRVLAATRTDGATRYRLRIWDVP